MWLYIPSCLTSLILLAMTTTPATARPVLMLCVSVWKGERERERVGLEKLRTHRDQTTVPAESRTVTKQCDRCNGDALGIKEPSAFWCAAAAAAAGLSADFCLSFHLTWRYLLNDGADAMCARSPPPPPTALPLLPPPSCEKIPAGAQKDYARSREKHVKATWPRRPFSRRVFPSGGRGG